MNQCYTDFHFHTNFSPDSTESLENQINAGLNQGVSMLCPTDHWDLVDEETPTKNPKLPLWHQEILEMREKFKETKNLSLFFGVEIGEGFVRPDIVKQALENQPLDFVLGSVHAVESVDFAKGIGIYHATAGLETHQEYVDFLEKYFKALLLQSQQDFFDSLSHINYPFRYLPPHITLTVQDFPEQLTAVLENLLKQDKVFEFNTTRGQTIEVWEPILTRYLELGGKHVTLGSDAHVAKDMSKGITQALELLKSLGFTSYCYFEKRQRKILPIL